MVYRNLEADPGENVLNLKRVYRTEADPDIVALKR
jgi:hypothetical protein